MSKKCVYCCGQILDDRAVDVCDKCGVGVWGPKMFKAIMDNMSQAKEKGDLMQGLVNEDLQKSVQDKNFKPLG